MDDTNDRRGRDSVQHMGLQEVADMFGVSKVAVHQVEKSALRKMREHPIMRQLAIDAGFLQE